MFYLNRIHFSLILLFVISLSACGGGGGSDAPPTETNNSNWDQLVWDQDNWE